ncbi:MAG: DUF4349 domain-containing protein [Candidatus Hydrogenedentes bacterium]|nr:DUF4349 domain-containing protein [Candidatus Hydrogenedentota bacterium]
MRNLRVLAVVLVAAGLAVWGCGRGYEAAKDSRGLMGLAEMAAPASQPAPAVQLDRFLASADEAQASAGRARGESAAPGVGGLTDLAANQPDVYLIKNATVTIECDDARTATDSLVASLQAISAYVSNLNERVDALGRRTVTLQVRVPADKFDQSMTSLESLGRVLNKQVTTQDVTEEYVDTDSRTRNLKQTETRLLDHLNRAAQLEDILRVESELTRVREEIERLDGRLRFLKDRVSFSTISVTIQEKAKAEPIVPPQSFSTAKEFSEAARSLVEFLQRLWSRAIWIIVWLPVYGAIAAAVYGVYRAIKRRLF